jgi:hypothetical protein
MKLATVLVQGRRAAAIVVKCGVRAERDLEEPWRRIRRHAGAVVVKPRVEAGQVDRALKHVVDGVR